MANLIIAWVLAVSGGNLMLGEAQLQVFRSELFNNNQSQFLLVNDRTAFDTGAAICNGLNATLAQVLNEEEFNILKSFFRDIRFIGDAWLGNLFLLLTKILRTILSHRFERFCR